MLYKMTLCLDLPTNPWQGTRSSKPSSPAVQTWLCGAVLCYSRGSLVQSCLRTHCDGRCCHYVLHPDDVTGTQAAVAATHEQTHSVVKQKTGRQPINTYGHVERTCLPGSQGAPMLRGRRPEKHGAASTLIHMPHKQICLHSHSAHLP